MGHRLQTAGCRLFASAWTAATLVAVPCFAQSRQLEQQVNRSIEQFASPNWQQRASAFYDLLKLIVPNGDIARTDNFRPAMINLFASLPAREEEIRVTFVALLEKENNSAHAGLGEGFYNYSGREVTDALTNLAEHDPYWRPGEPGQPAQYYLVRERAKAALLSRQGR